MNKQITISAILAFFATVALADTQVVNSTQSAVIVSQNQTFQNSNGDSIETGGVTHITGHDVNGEKNSQWCTGTFASKGEDFLGGAGYCTVVNEDGDYLWVWWRPTSPTANEWGVIAGTGAWQGATGGGTTETTTQMVDGTWISQSNGKIVTN